MEGDSARRVYHPIPNTKVLIPLLPSTPAHATWARKKSDTYLHGLTNTFSLTQDLTQVLGSQHIAQGGLRQQTSGTIGIFHVCNWHGGIVYSEVHHCIYCYSNTVLCQNLDTNYTTERIKIKTNGNMVACRTGRWPWAYLDSRPPLLVIHSLCFLQLPPQLYQHFIKQSGHEN